MNKLEHLKENKKIFFTFMNEKYPVIYKSNIFLRDMQYAIHTYFTMKEGKINYREAEQLTNEFASFLEEENELIKLNSNTWAVNFKKEKIVEENPQDKNQSKELEAVNE
ncbi:MAG: hypothetical protein PVH88_23630 [Ignavibacteria bacterium]|jgi:hypothetical protein